MHLLSTVPYGTRTPPYSDRSRLIHDQTSFRPTPPSFRRQPVYTEIRNQSQQQINKSHIFRTFKLITMAAEPCPLSFTISLEPNGENDDPSKLPIVPQHVRESFSEDGFVVVENVLSQEHVNTLNDRLEDILRGTYDRGKAPDKTPRLLKAAKIQSSCNDKCDNLRKITATAAEPSGTKKTKKKLAPAAGPLGFSGNLQNVKVLQVINVHKADAAFRQFACSMALGKVVAELAGWKDGARLAQDQVWAKPPGAPPLVFHRDAPYFMFEPASVVTVWLALDDMDAELGPLEYVRGSHKWGHGRVGSANQFFQSNGGLALLKSAAAKEGIVEDLDIVSMAGLRAGGMSIHDGLTWHGSGRNQSRKRPRRGLGLHFVPANVHFTDQAIHSSLWKSYVMDAEDPAAVELPAEDFPISWQP
jgi:ectoine hydroxylase-related dioxygenase (phytanoyl-CoA dioxygenase family)